MKKITVQSISKEGIKNLGQTIIEMATAESLEAHANAVRVRL
jgi:histidinol dehydrogenase